MKYKTRYQDKIDSTNEYLKSHFLDLENHTVFYTDYQTGGHGRFTRKWESEEGKNLLLSVLLKHSKYFEHGSFLPILVGVTVFETLTHFGLNGLSIKWPNDIYVNGKKICGILLESRVSAYIVIGVGLNINQDNFDTPNATSMKLECGKEFDRYEVREYFLKLLFKKLKCIKHIKKKCTKILAANNYLLNKKVSYDSPQQTGTVVGINENNELIIKNNNGEEILLKSGEANLVIEK